MASAINCLLFPHMNVCAFFGVFYLISLSLSNRSTLIVMRYNYNRNDCHAMTHTALAYYLNYLSHLVATDLVFLFPFNDFMIMIIV